MYNKIRKQTKETYMTDSFIRGFSKGISSMTFFPSISRRGIPAGGAFQAVGNNIRKAMNEQPAPLGKETR
jgi:hypothetical protein